MMTPDSSLEEWFFQPWCDFETLLQSIEGVPQSDPRFSVLRDLQPSVRGDQEVDPEAIPIFQPV